MTTRPDRWDRLSDRYEDRAYNLSSRFERNPFTTLFAGLLFLMLFGTCAGVVGTSLGWFSEAATIAREELGPRALLEKYEWFKDAHAQLNKKLADIQVFEQRVELLRKDFGADTSHWPRDIRQEYILSRTEVAGIIASYNNLAAQYNSAMAKLNYRFTNLGMLPEGATEPLPREYARYKEGV